MTTPAVVSGSRAWRSVAVVAVTAGLFMGLLDLSIVTIVIPEIGRSLDAGFGQLSWVVNAYVLLEAAVILPAGKLGDLFGRRAVFVSGMAVFAVSSLLAGLAPNPEMLIASRALQGLGGAAMVTLSLPLLTQLLPENRSLAWTVWSATGGLALALGPSLGGLLTETLSWRWVFVVNVPVAAMAVPVVVVLVQETRVATTHGARFDWAGLLTVVAGLVALSLGLLQGQAWGWSSMTVLGLLGGSAVLLLAFLVVEARSPFPMLPLKYFALPRFSAACLGWFGAMFAFIAVFFFLPVYLEVVRGYSVLKASLALSPGPLAAFFVAPLAGLLARRIGAGPVAAFGVAVVGAAVMLTSRVSTETAYTQLVLLAIFTGVGFGFAVPTLTELAMDSLHDDDAGVGSGAFSTVRQVAAVVAISSLGAALQRQMVSSFAAGLANSVVIPINLHPLVAAEFQRRATQRAGLASDAVPPELAAELHRLASIALVDGLQWVFVIAGIVCFSGLLLLTFLLRRALPLNTVPFASGGAHTGDVC